jgi:thiol-disulfide isomerase/thioredoxin
MEIWMSGMASVALLMATLGGTPDGVVLDFSAAWCGPCQSMDPIVERLQKQGYAIQKVDFDRNRQFAAQLNVTHLPTFLLIVDGKVRQRFIGPMSENSLRRMAAAIPKKTKAVVTRPQPRTQPRPHEAPTQPQRAPSPRFGPRKKVESKPSPTKRVVRANDDNPKYAEVISQKPTAVCARIRVHLEGSVDIGSGTIIHSEPGKTLILTCGHIFRGFNSSSTIEVDLFHRAQPETYDATLIKADLNADIGLISLREMSQFPVAPIAKRSAQKGNHVYSIGCGGGAPPSRLQHLVTSTDVFQPDFVECTDLPVQGRSGGGLFTRDGEVVGVCVLADPESRRGLYTSLRTLHRLLDSCQLSSLAPRPKLDRAEPNFANAKPKQDQIPPSDAAPPRFVGDQQEPSPIALTRIDRPTSRPAVSKSNVDDSGRFVPRFGPVADNETNSTQVLSSVTDYNGSMSKLREALSAARGAEVICLIRSKDQPQRIIIIHEASEKFVADLANELTNQVRPTSMTVRRLPFMHLATASQMQPRNSGSPSPRMGTNEFQRYRRSSRRMPVFLPAP